MLKNKIFTILLMTMLAMPVIAIPEFEDEINSGPLTPITQEVPESSIQEELPNLNTIPYKQPSSKRKLVKKFLLAMGAVGISSVALFLILSMYNNIRKNIINAKDFSTENETSLATPDSLNEAIKTFLDKTKWS